MVNVPSPDTSLIRQGGRACQACAPARPGWDWTPTRSSMARSTTLSITDSLAGSLNGELFTQDAMTVVKGRLPRLGATGQIVLTASVARLFGVGVGGEVTYQFENNGRLWPRSPRVTPPTGWRPSLTYRRSSSTSSTRSPAAVLPPAATAAAARHVNSLVFSWVGLRLTGGSAGIPAFQASLARLAGRVGGGYTFAVRQLDTVHQQVQEAIRPQAVALGDIRRLCRARRCWCSAARAWPSCFDRSAPEVGVAQGPGPDQGRGGHGQRLGAAVRRRRRDRSWPSAGAVALSALGPDRRRCGRSTRPAVYQFDVTVLAGGALVRWPSLLLGTAGLVGVAVGRRDDQAANPAVSRRPSRRLRRATGGGRPRRQLRARPAAREVPGHGRGPPWWDRSWPSPPWSPRSSSAPASTAWSPIPPATAGTGTCLIQAQGGYGSFLPDSVNATTLGGRATGSSTSSWPRNRG